MLLWWPNFTLAARFYAGGLFPTGTCSRCTLRGRTPHIHLSSLLPLRHSQLPPTFSSSLLTNTNPLTVEDIRTHVGSYHLIPTALDCRLFGNCRPTNTHSLFGRGGCDYLSLPTLSVNTQVIRGGKAVTSFSSFLPSYTY